MNLPEQYQEIIIKEFKNILNLCKGANSIYDKLFFFSASFGVINRIMNINCDPTLIFTHQILQNVHQGFLQRLTSLIIPGTISNSLPDIMIDALFSYFSELILAFEVKDEVKIREILEKFTNLWYATTGNGFYLFLNEKIKI